MLFKQNNKKERNAFIFNLIITILVLIGVVFKFTVDNIIEGTPIGTVDWSILKYFTLQSNLVMGVVACIYFIFLIRKNKGKIKVLPTGLECTKLFATCYVALTGIVTVTMLTPGAVLIQGYEYDPLLLYIGSNLIFHVLIPILACITWLLFENTNKIKFKYIWFVLIYFGIYAIIYTVLAYTHVNPDGSIPDPYDWYRFCAFGPYISPIVLLVIAGIMFGVTAGFWKANKSIHIKYK